MASNKVRFMTDTLTSERRSANMRAIRSQDMKPELRVRRIAHAMGYRFRLHRRDLPGKPDLVFSSRQKAIFVHGCFWHQHAECTDGHLPQSNSGYWGPKLMKNKERDTNHIAKLKNGGWEVLIIWECETEDKLRLQSQIGDFLSL
jgi:DNA mismatch endonuclease (patch repair protein)